MPLKGEITSTPYVFMSNHFGLSLECEFSILEGNRQRSFIKHNFRVVCTQFSGLIYKTVGKAKKLLSARPKKPRNKLQERKNQARKRSHQAETNLKVKLRPRMPSRTSIPDPSFSIFSVCMHLAIGIGRG